MGITRYITALYYLSHPVYADVSTVQSCVGVIPNWALELSSGTARLSYQGTDADMTIMQDGTAEGAKTTRAMTLVGRQQSAIAVFKQGACQINAEQFPINATILTQLGDVPIILEGCCYAHSE